MPPVAVCPEDRVFREVLVGDATLEVEYEAARHFLNCERCAKRAQAALTNEQTRKAVQRRGEDRPLWRFWADSSKLVGQAATIERVEATEETRQFEASASGAAAQPSADKEDTAATRELTTSIYAFLTPPESSDEIGRIGQYRVVKLLGAGGMGMVFQAQDPHLKRKVALKVMRPEAAAQENAKSRFLREARTMASLEHDHVVAVFQVGEDRGVPFLAMPFLQGMPLDAVLKKNPTIPLTIALRMGYQIANGLAAAHAKGLIHRDIKPANIWIETQNNNRVKLLDFGLARGDEEDVQLTQSGSVLGTPAYMAPEQAAGGAIDSRADLFSLGVVLYELTTGKRPFTGANTMAILTALAVHNPPAPCEVASSVPETVSALIMRLLEKDPARRVGSAQEAAKELAALIKNKVAPSAPGATEEKALAETAILAASLPTVRALERPKELTAPGRSASSASGGNRRLWSAIGAGGLGAFALLFAVVTIFFQTPYGTLEVQIDDPAIEARFKNGALILADEEGKTRYTLRPAAELADKTEKIKTGDYKLRVEGADGLTVDTENFILRDGKREIVKVILRPSTSESSQPTPATPPKIETVAAAWKGWPAEGPKPAIATYNAAQAREFQKAWSEHLKVPVEYTNSVGMKFVLIPPGEYVRGSTAEELKEYLDGSHQPDIHWRELFRSTTPQHKVVLTKAFYLGVCEVTQSQYLAVMGVNPAAFSAAGKRKAAVSGEATDAFPVDSVTFVQCAALANKLSANERLSPSYLFDGTKLNRAEANGYRMPTEAEWEFACRAGTTTRYYCGDVTLARENGWIATNSSSRTHVVAGLAPNPFGLYDVIGNVWEWTEDAWQDDYQSFSVEPAVDPLPSFAHSARTGKGGAYNAAPNYSVSATRGKREQTTTDSDMGVRLLLSVDGVRELLQAAKNSPSSAPP